MESINKENLTALLVEDDSINQIIISSILKKMTMQVDIAANGAIGVEKTKQKKYDFIVMDIQMPVMNGIEAINIIRQELKITTPILVVTSNTLANTEKLCKETDANDYFLKPIEPTSFIAKVDEMLKNHRAAPPKTANIQHQPAEAKEMFSLKKMSSLLGNNQSEVKRLAEMFLQVSPPILQEMNERLTQKQYELLGNLAHKMKPSIDILEIENLKDVIRSIEKFGKNNINTDQLNDLMDELNTTLQIVFKTLTVEIAKL